MTLSYSEAFARLSEAENLFQKQDISVLEGPARLKLLQMEQQVYLEKEALIKGKMSERAEQYQALTGSIQKFEADFRELETDARIAAQTGQAVAGMLRGLSLVLSLL
jgi:acyl carrier protein phosphodiesterase